MILIQDTWCDDDDDYELLEYLDKHHEYDYTIVSDYFKDCDTYDITFLLCDTNIFQSYAKRNNIHLIIPDTYPDCLSPLFGRTIQKLTYEDVSLLTMPFFAKSSSQTKKFSHIVNNTYDLANIKECITNEYGYMDELIYVSNVVTFVNEYRLFISNKKLAGIVETSRYILSSDKIVSQEPPGEFLDKVLELNEYDWCIIDVGMLDTGQWVIVEVNPPFSFNRYGWEIPSYLDFCSQHYQKISQI